MLARATALWASYVRSDYAQARVTEAWIVFCSGAIGVCLGSQAPQAQPAWRAAHISYVVEQVRPVRLVSLATLIPQRPVPTQAISPPPKEERAAVRCLQPAARALLAEIESRFGRVGIVSTCRPGAVIAGTDHPSLHRYGRAIDFEPPAGKRAAVLAWLVANHKSGGTMTYTDYSHIHVDIGPHFVSLAGLRRGAKHAGLHSTYD